MTCDMPGWAALMRSLLRDASSARCAEASGVAMEACQQAVDDGNFSMAASLLRDVMTPAEVDESIRRQFGLHVLHQATPEKQARTYARMENLVRAPWAGIVTTNYDELIEFAIGKWATGEVVKTDGGDPRLGVILSSAPLGGFFFVKVHGSVGGSRVVLGTEEYDRTYLATPQMTAFLGALMLRYHVVFVGCSLEDEILRIRRKLCHDFQRMIPTAYALLPRSRINRTRWAWLREQAQIESLFYPESDQIHGALDQFLLEAARCCDAGPAALAKGATQAELAAMGSEACLDVVGIVNLQLLRVIADQPSHSIRHVDLLNLLSANLVDRNIGPIVADITPEERVYRVLFLASIGLLEEKRTADGSRSYGIAPSIAEALTRKPSGGGATD
jgi:SIR2-like domain